ncbi:MAG: integration host factor subunit beta [Gammaproteobacteria bacterium]|nr:MAG: integration host factor subunit beta [Gammaproteobacteria bacterium]
MTKSELIERIAANHSQLSSKDVELAVKEMLEHMSSTLWAGARIEIRGFGSFSLHYRAPALVEILKQANRWPDCQIVPHFKPGKELRDRVNRTLEKGVAEQS